MGLFDTDPEDADVPKDTDELEDDFEDAMGVEDDDELL